MVTNVLISGVEYRAVNDYQIKQQAGAVASTSITVNRVTAAGTLNAIPVSQQSAVIKIDNVIVFSGIIQKVTGIEHATGYEPTLFDLEIQSIEAVFNRRLVTHNFYKTSFPTISDIVSWLYTNVMAEEGITLGAISTTTEYIRSYKKSYEKLADVLDDLAERIDGCSWYVTPGKVFYFLIASDFPSVTMPEHITSVKYSEASGDLRTVQTVIGASSRIKSTLNNADLIASLAALSGTSGKIEVSESDSSIHNETDALSSALKKIAQYNEREKTITLTCHDLAASATYNTWHFVPGWLPTDSVMPDESHLPGSGNGTLPAEIEGDFVVTERTISAQEDILSISVTLKNRNYFCRYGYSYKKFAKTGKSSTDEISNIYSDDKLTPVEKITTRKEWTTAASEKATYDDQADLYGLSRTAYDIAFQMLTDYLNDGAAWSSGYPAWINDDNLSETTDFELAVYIDKWNAYESAKKALIAAIENAITSGTQDYADDLAAALQLQVDRAIVYYTQASDPSTDWNTTVLKNGHIGDYWRIATGAVWQQWSGTAWTEISDPVAQSAADAAQGTADTKTTVWATFALAQASAEIGDLFLDASLLYRCTVASASITFENSTRLTQKRYADVADATALAALTGMIAGDTVYQIDTRQWYVYTTSWIADGVAQLVPADVVTYTPKNLGRYEAAHPSTHSSGDWWTIYDTDDDPIQRGIWYDNAGTPTRISAVSGETGYTTDATLLAKLSSCMADVAWCEKNSYGTASNYGIEMFFESFGAVTAFIQQLFAQNINFTGSFAGEHISIVSNKLEMWSGTSLTSPAYGDSLMRIDIQDEVPKITWFRCITSGVWTAKHAIENALDDNVFGGRIQIGAGGRNLTIQNESNLSGGLTCYIERTYAINTKSTTSTINITVKKPLSCLLRSTSGGRAVLKMAYGTSSLVYYTLAISNDETPTPVMLNPGRYQLVKEAGTNAYLDCLGAYGIDNTTIESLATLWT